MTTRQAQRIYLAAARMIGEGSMDYSCLAVRDAARLYRIPIEQAVHPYLKVFMPVLLKDDRWEWYSTQLTIDQRILMLCLMAAAYPDLKEQGVFDE